MKKILIQYFTLPHYRVPLFNLLAEKYDITVLYTPYCVSKVKFTGIPVNPNEQFKFKTIKTKYIEFNIFNLFFQYQTKLLREIYSKKYDLIIVQANFQNFCTIIALILARILNIPIIWWNKGYAAYSKRNKIINNIIFRTIYKLPQIHIPYGDSTINYLKKLGVNNKKIVRCYNTIDVERIYKNKKYLKEQGRDYLSSYFDSVNEEIIITTVGRLIPKKRVMDICQTVNLLLKDSYNIVLVIVGDGPEKNRIKKWIDENKLNKNIFLTGKVPVNLDNAIIAYSDIFISCGRLGLSINQAMALKKIVVVADEDGPDGELVIHNHTGFRYKKGDICELYHLLKKLIDNNLDYDTIVRKAQEEVLINRNLKNYCLSFKKAINSLI